MAQAIDEIARITVHAAAEPEFDQRLAIEVRGHGEDVITVETGILEIAVRVHVDHVQQHAVGILGIELLQKLGKTNVFAILVDEELIRIGKQHPLAKAVVAQHRLLPGDAVV